MFIIRNIKQEDLIACGSNSSWERGYLRIQAAKSNSKGGKCVQLKGNRR